VVSSVAKLCWCITKSNLPYADLFFSPYLEEVFIYSSPSWDGATPAESQTIASTISALPASALQFLRVGQMERFADLKDSLSSVALRCGPELEVFTSPCPLSEAAANHLIRLPHLRIWHVGGPPPSYSTLSLPTTFPPLTEFGLEGDAAHGWLSLFQRLEDSVTPMRGVTPLSKMKESLESQTFKDTPGLIIDVSFASPIRIFRNLVNLHVEVGCRDQCTFKLDDGDVAKLAIELPQLESLLLGYPCSENTCATTAVCLLLISVYCVNLGMLRIHFNTATIVNDLKNISEDPQFQELRSLPKCPLSRLGVWKLPPILDEPGIETVVNGMIDIFPSLEFCETRVRCPDWAMFTKRIAIGRLRRLISGEPVSIVLGFLLRLIHP